jgi:Tfp pilus assembly protein PilV
MSKKSFTLIEILIALSLLMIGVVGVFRVVQNITFFSQINSSKLIATYLTQEGIEVVRNNRDSNWLKGDTWDSNLVRELPLIRFPLDQKFTRNVTTTPTTTPDGSDKIIIVEVNVSWRERGKEYSVIAQTHLYNWK